MPGSMSSKSARVPPYFSCTASRCSGGPGGTSSPRLPTPATGPSPWTFVATEAQTTRPTATTLQLRPPMPPECSAVWACRRPMSSGTAGAPSVHGRWRCSRPISSAASSRSPCRTPGPCAVISCARASGPPSATCSTSRCHFSPSGPCGVRTGTASRSSCGGGRRQQTGSIRRPRSTAPPSCAGPLPTPPSSTTGGR
ncbi:unannotated protein [freshwater metagenome]|uniref:Unannotated protein n=1 Tax=freshwater metagenome TaxID=449393 RepID=A0A6J7J4P5_9ZZZZ